MDKHWDGPMLMLWLCEYANFTCLPAISSGHAWASQISDVAASTLSNSTSAWLSFGMKHTVPCEKESKKVSEYGWMLCVVRNKIKEEKKTQKWERKQREERRDRRERGEEGEDGKRTGRRTEEGEKHKERNGVGQEKTGKNK